PSSSRATAKFSPLGRTCTSKRSLETSIPTTTVASIFTPPCAIGLRDLRPTRLFGFDGTAGGEPCSPRAISLGGIGLPPATAPDSLSDAPLGKLQGGPCEAWWRGLPLPQGDRIFLPALGR